jgi:hypothetical protein
MKHHLSSRYLHPVYATLAFVLASVMLLWSWNTLSMLFDGPVAQYKHALAALVFAWVVGWGLRGAGRVRRPWHEKPNSGS